MTNNFEKMMETMMGEMMEKMMSKMMEKMFSTMMDTPEVSEAVAEAKPQAMSIEELLALEVEEDKTVKKYNDSLKPLDFIVEDFKPRNGRKFHKGLKYNKYITNKAVWTYNHLQIRKNYPNIKYSNGYYYADSLSDLQAFASSYHVTEKLTEDQFQEVKTYWDSKKK